MDKTSNIADLLALAEFSDIEVLVQHGTDGIGTIVLANLPTVEYDPLTNLTQNYLLLEAVIANGDCRLFNDHEMDEFFIYKYETELAKEIMLAHRTKLTDTVYDAAMALWCSENTQENKIESK